MKPIISQNIRLRYPDLFEIGDDSIVDDYSYFSTRIKVGRWSHLAHGLTIGGGPEYRFELGDGSGICAGTRIYVTSNDFSTGLVAVAVPGAIRGDVIFGNYTGIGCNSMVMPDNHIPDGVAIGALSFVPSGFKFESWTVYAGNPIRKVGYRDVESVMAEVASLR